MITEKQDIQHIGDNNKHGYLLEQPDQEEIDIRKTLATLWRRKMVIIGTVVTITAISMLVVIQLTPKYTAEILVMIENRKTKVVDIESVISELSSDSVTIQSEVQVLLSRSLAGKVVDKLKLSEKPEFNGLLKPKHKGIFAELNIRKHIPEEWITALFGKKKEEEPTKDEKKALVRMKVIGAYLSKLSIFPIRGSRVIKISFESKDPKLAALTANTIADQYIVAQLEAKFQATKRANEWLNEKLSGLRNKVKESEGAVEIYRKESGLIEAKGMTVSSQQMSELNSHLILARADRREAEARLQSLEALMLSPEGIESVEEVLSSPFIQRLRGQEALLLRKISELVTEYGERHPIMINARAEIREVREKMKTEVNKIAKGLRNKVEVVKVRERSLEEDLEVLKIEVGEFNRAEVKLRALEREAKANRTLFETFLSRFKETSSQEDINQADVRIISRADAPISPSYPRKKLFVGLAFVASVLLGLFLVFVLELLDSGFRSMDQIEAMSGVPALGLVPMLNGMNRLARSPLEYILEKPNSAYGESIRTLRTALLLSNVDIPPKVVLITSSVPGEGKTTIAVSIARLAARSGQKVIAVDCDLRRPSFKKILTDPKKEGLVELLAGESSLEEVLCTDKSGADYITSGRPAPNPSDLLGSKNLKKLLSKLSENYDLVMLDSSPVLPVSDSRILSHVADKTFFVVRWERTNRDLAIAGIKQIIDSGADLAGVVLTQVNVRKHARYGYSDSGYYYYREYHKYYTYSDE